MCSRETIPGNSFYGAQFILKGLINFEKLRFILHDTAVWRSGTKFIAELGSVALGLEENLDTDIWTQMPYGWFPTRSPTYAHEPGDRFCWPSDSKCLLSLETAILEPDWYMLIFVFLIHDVGTQWTLKSRSLVYRGLENSVPKNAKQAARKGVGR